MAGPKGALPRTLDDLNARIQAIAPDLKVRMGYATHLWLYKGLKGGSLRVTADGSDLATGPLRRLGLTVEQRQAIAATILEWRAGQ